MSKAVSGQEIDDASDEAEEVSLDDFLQQAFDDDRSDDLEEAGEAKTEGDAADEVNDNGQDEGDTGPDETAENAAATNVDDQEKTEAAEPLDAPEHWPTGRREAFSKLDRNAQDLLLSQAKDLEAGFTRRSQELSEAAKFSDVVREEFKPFKDELALVGMDELGGLRYLLAAHKAISNNPVQAISQLMHTSGLTVADFIQPDGAQQEIDPHLAALQNQVGQLTNHIQQSEQAKAQERQRELVSQIDAFKSEVDETGASKRPHFEALKGSMAAMLSSGQVTNLDEAYEAALWSNPDLRRQQLEAQTRAKNNVVDAEKKKAVERAKKVGKRPPSGSPTKLVKPVNDLDDALLDAFEAHWE